MNLHLHTTMDLTLTHKEKTAIQDTISLLEEIMNDGEDGEIVNNYISKETGDTPFDIYNVMVGLERVLSSSRIEDEDEEDDDDY